MNLRDRPRYEVVLGASYSGDEITGKGTVANLSLGGCALKGDSAVRVGTFLEVKIELPVPFAPLAVELATVRWTIGTKFGLDFLQMQPDQETLLSRFLKTLK